MHGGPSAIAVGENGQINRIDKYSDVNTEITYLLRDNVAINATMKVVSSGKWHTVKYVHESTVTVEGPSEIFVNNNCLSGDPKQII
jgi:hypothetical protein